MPWEDRYAALRGTALAVSVIAIAVVAGCGGGGSDSSTATGSAQAGTEQAGAGSGGPESFGEEASPGDRAAATKAVQEFVRAWTDGDSARACSLMAAPTKENLAVFASQLTKSGGCTEQAEAVRSRISAKTLGRIEGIQVTGVRVEGDHGFVLYRDARGNSSAFPIVREGSAWKAGAILGSRLP